MVESVKISEAQITPEALVEWTSRLGLRLKIGNRFNSEVTEDNVRHFADGIGDPNPLWRDAEYAKNTSYGRLPAPPSWLYSVFPTWVLQGLPGIHAFHSGNDWTFHKPIRVGDRIVPECIFSGFEVRGSKFAGRTVLEYQHSRFHNQKGELVAETDVWLFRAERAAAREKGKYSKYRLPHPWTEEQLARIEEEILSERPAGLPPCIGRM